MSSARPLSGRVVVTTRDHRSELDSQLALLGADVVHVPLFSIDHNEQHRTALTRALDRLSDNDWVVVTSRHGAAAIGPVVTHRPFRLAAVGAATAIDLEQVCGRPVDVVPVEQRAVALADAMPAGPGGLVIAQADRADSSLATALSAKGYDVTPVVAYANHLRSPSQPEVAAATQADAVVFASGSAAQAWMRSIGDVIPPVVVAIGPTTAAAAESVGVSVTHTAETHDIAGLVATVTSALTARS